MHLEVSFIKKAYLNGVLGYLLKTSHPEEIIKAIKTVLTGKKYFINEVANILFEDLDAKTKNQRIYLDNPILSKREVQIIHFYAKQFSTKNTAVTIVRTGIVLAPKGGALEKMKTPIIVPLGSGEQHLPWIHIDDLCHIYLKIIGDNLTGVFNAVSPEHHTNKTFSKVLAKSLKRPYIGIGIPRIALKVLFGKLAVLLLEGSRISSKKIEKNGYSFRFKTLAKALNNL